MDISTVGTVVVMAFAVTALGFDIYYEVKQHRLDRDTPIDIDALVTEINKLSNRNKNRICHYVADLAKLEAKKR